MIRRRTRCIPSADAGAVAETGFSVSVVRLADGGHVLESTVEDYLRTRVESYGGRCDKVVDLTRIGCPDREVQWPGVGVDKVELKKPKKKPESHQTRYHEYLAKCNVPVYLLDTKEKVDAYIEHRGMKPHLHCAWLFSVPCDPK